MHDPIPAHSPDLIDPPENTSPESVQFRAESGIHQDLDISDLQFRAIQLTVSGMNDREISASLDVDRKTLWRWKTLDDDYRAALASVRENLYSAFLDRCQNHLAGASKTIVSFMEHSTDDKLRLRAAQILLQQGSRYRPLKHVRNRQSQPAPQLENDFPEPQLEPKIG